MQWIVEIQSSSTDYMLRGSQEANRLELIKYISLHNFDMFIYIEKGKDGMLVTHIYVYIILMPVKYIYRYVYIYWKRKTECWLHIYMFI